jgi:hypothetical protein
MGNVSDNMAENSDVNLSAEFLQSVTLDEKSTTQKNEDTNCRRDHFLHFGDHVAYKLSIVKKYHRFASPRFFSFTFKFVTSF